MKKNKIIIAVLMCLFLLLSIDTFAAVAKVGADADFNGDLNISGIYKIGDSQISSDDLSDVASLAMLDENEVVIGEWEFIDQITLSRAVDYAPAAPDFYFQRSRDGDPTSDVSNNDALGFIVFNGVFTSPVPAAGIVAYVDGEPAANKVPGRLEFSTTPVGSVDPVLRMAIDNAGNIKMGDGVWTNYVNISNAGVLTFKGTANITPKYTTTTVTAVHTMTVAEAGNVFVSCATTPYTITLPTAVGNTGLTYNFKKTDANYNLITLDGDGTETFNYENSTGAPVLTYARLNTYGAEATVVSDGSNWQVINEKLGQVPEGKAFLNTSQLNTTYFLLQFVDINEVITDIGSNFDFTTWVSGNATSTSADHLVDSGGSFTATMVGHQVKNTTDTTYTYVTVYNSATDLTVRDNIFVNTEGYEIKNCKYVAPISGKYIVEGQIKYINTSIVADKVYGTYIYKDTTQITSTLVHSSHISWVTPLVLGETQITAGQEIFFKCYNESGGNGVDIYGNATGYGDTWLSIRLISKD